LGVLFHDVLGFFVKFSEKKKIPIEKGKRMGYTILHPKEYGGILL
jgi:hypothetical protein